MNDDFQVFEAKPIEDMSKTAIKWPKRKFKLVRGKTHLKYRTPFHPSTKEARQILDQVGRNLRVCQNCGSSYRVSVHHQNKNPFDNHIENLSVLCSDCHSKAHGIEACV